MPWCLQHSVYKFHPEKWKPLMSFSSEEEARAAWGAVFAVVNTIANSVGARVRKFDAMIVALEFPDRKESFKVSKLHKC